MGRRRFRYHLKRERFLHARTGWGPYAGGARSNNSLGVPYGRADESRGMYSMRNGETVATD